MQGPRLYVLHWTAAYRLTLPYEFDSQRQLACKHKQLRTKLPWAPRAKNKICVSFSWVNKGKYWCLQHVTFSSSDVPGPDGEKSMIWVWEKDTFGWFSWPVCVFPFPFLAVTDVHFKQRLQNECKCTNLYASVWFLPWFLQESGFRSVQWVSHCNIVQSDGLWRERRANSVDQTSCWRCILNCWY